MDRIKQQLNETLITRGKILESDRKKLPEGVLCRVTYPICNIGVKNHNGRKYTKEVWEKVHENKEINEKLANRTLFGHAEHPKETQSNLEKTSHIVTKMYQGEELFEGKKILVEYADFDILDTPYGRIVDTLLKADCGVGVSTRAEGELEEAIDEDGTTYQKVVPESYRFVTVDFTADPSTLNVKPMNLQRDIINTIQAGVESKKMAEDDAVLILESLDSPEAKELAKSIKGDKLQEEVSGSSDNIDLIASIKSVLKEVFGDKEQEVERTSSGWEIVVKGVSSDEEGWKLAKAKLEPYIKDNNKISIGGKEGNLLVTVEEKVNEEKVKLESEDKQNEKKIQEDVGGYELVRAEQDGTAYENLYVLVTKDREYWEGMIEKVSEEHIGEKKVNEKKTGEKRLLESSIGDGNFNEWVKTFQEIFAGMDEEKKEKVKTIITESKDFSDLRKRIVELEVKEASSRAESDKMREEIEKISSELDKVRENYATDCMRLSKEIAEKDSNVISLNQKIEEAKKKTEETIKELISQKEVVEKKIEFETKRLKEQIQKESIKSYVKGKLNSTQLTLHQNSLALLESCKSIEEVDEMFIKLRDAVREGIVHSSIPKNISIFEHVDEEQSAIESAIGSAFKGMKR